MNERIKGLAFVPDRKTVGGAFLGAALVLSAVASAETTASVGSWFSGLFSTSGSSDSGSTTLLSQQDSVVATAINEESTKCANGEAGTIGEAIKTAMNVHTELASASPKVESLFDVGSDCFASINQLYDLSFAIPSLGAILGAAQQAVLDFAKKKVCTAVNQVTGMVTSPINDAITKVNSLQQFTNINGMANTAVGGAMSQLDPKLGSSYHPETTGGTYSVNTNPFGANQTTFETGTNSTSSQTNSQLAANTATINQLTAQIGEQQIAINQATMDLSSAQQAYDSCNGWAGEWGGCSAQLNNLNNAKAKLAQDQQNLANLQTQLSQVTQGTTTSVTTGSMSLPNTGTTSSDSSSSTSGSSWWGSLSGLF
jgi:hypothetical protein